MNALVGLYVELMIKKMIYERLVIYHKHEQALLDFYKACGHVLISVNAEQPLQAVYNELVLALGY